MSMDYTILPQRCQRWIVCAFSFALIFLAGCEESVEHTAPPIYPQDSVSVMTTWGVNTLVSDSGIIRYRIVTEKWEVNQVKNPSFWRFDKGLFLEQFDEKFHIVSYIQSDTAYYYDQRKLWELRGRVRVRTKDGLRFSSEELFWDQVRREFYSNMFSRVVTPVREMQGTRFLSDEGMTHYTVSNSKGSFLRGADGMGTSESDTLIGAPDSVKSQKRLPNTAKPRTDFLNN